MSENVPIQKKMYNVVKATTASYFLNCTNIIICFIVVMGNSIKEID